MVYIKGETFFERCYETTVGCLIEDIFDQWRQLAHAISPEKKIKRLALNG
jgi:hypothetical protein